MNTLQVLLSELNEPAYKVADKANVTRNTVYRLVKGDDIPDTRLNTLRKVAEALGYRVEIVFKADHGS